MPLTKAKSNWYNNLSDFDLLDDFTASNSPLILTVDSRSTGFGAAQSAVSDPPRAGVWLAQTAAGTTGASGFGGSSSYVFSSWQRLSIAANFRITTLADGTDSYRIFLGFNSSYDSTTNPITRSAGLLYSNASANWQAITYDASTGTSTDTGVAAVAGGIYNTFCVRVNGTSSVQFFINNSLVATNTTNIPTTTYTNPFLAIAKTAGTNSRSFFCDWIRFSGSGNSRSLGVSA